VTDPRPTIDRDALRARVENYLDRDDAGTGLRAVVDDLLDALDAETGRADAAEAEVTRLTAEVLDAADLADEAIIEQRDAARSERDSLGERIAAVRALCNDPDTPHAGSCASYRVFRTADGPHPCDCIVSQIRRALDGIDAARIARETT